MPSHDHVNGNLTLMTYKRPLVAYSRLDVGYQRPLVAYSRPMSEECAGFTPETDCKVVLTPLCVNLNGAMPYSRRCILSHALTVNPVIPLSRISNDKLVHSFKPQSSTNQNGERSRGCHDINPNRLSQIVHFTDYGPTLIKQKKARYKDPYIYKRNMVLNIKYGNKTYNPPLRNPQYNLLRGNSKMILSKLDSITPLNNLYSAILLMYSFPREANMKENYSGKHAHLSEEKDENIPYIYKDIGYPLN